MARARVYPPEPEVMTLLGGRLTLRASGPVVVAVLDDWPAPADHSNAEWGAVYVAGAVPDGWRPADGLAPMVLRGKVELVGKIGFNEYGDIYLYNQPKVSKGDLLSAFAVWIRG